MFRLYPFVQNFAKCIPLCFYGVKLNRDAKSRTLTFRGEGRYGLYTNSVRVTSRIRKHELPPMQSLPATTSGATMRSPSTIDLCVCACVRVSVCVSDDLVLLAKKQMALQGMTDKLNETGRCYSGNECGKK